VLQFELAKKTVFVFGL